SAEARNGVGEVGLQAWVRVREARAGSAEGTITEQVAEDFRAVLSDRLVAGDRKLPRHGNLVARSDLAEWLPAVDCQERMRERRPHFPPEAGLHLEDRLDAVVYEGRRL